MSKKSKKKSSVSHHSAPFQWDSLLLNMSEKDLRALHVKIVTRLKTMQKVRQLYEVSQFQIFERVSFLHNGERIFATIQRLNQKTVSLIGDDGMEWKVSPHFLEKTV